MEILTLENLSFRYPTEKENTLTDISLRIEEGDFAVLCGSSGCGKTTLLKLKLSKDGYAKALIQN